VLRQSGYSQKADDVLYASRVRERQQAWKLGEIQLWLWMWFMQLTIGYGIGLRKFRVFWSILITTGIGFFVLLIWSRKRERKDIFLLASLGHLLPIIELDKAHETLITSNNLPTLAFIFFQLQRFFGWALGLMLLGAFAGLTQQS
jgi:hypothetical protein